MFPVGHLQQRRAKAETEGIGHGNSFTTCEMTDLLKHRSKAPSSNISCGGSTAILPSSLNASIHAPYAPGKEVMVKQNHLYYFVIVYHSNPKN